MEVKDLLDNIEIQGPVIIKQWNEDKGDYRIILETHDMELRKREAGLEDLEILYMYVADGALVMEVQNMY